MGQVWREKLRKARPSGGKPRHAKALRLETLEDRRLLSAAARLWIVEPGENTSPPAGIQASDPFQFSDGDRWSATYTDGSGLVQGTPTTLRWGIVPDGSAIAPQYGGESSDPSGLVAFFDGLYGAGSGGSDLTQRPWFPIFNNSFARLAALSGLTFTYLAVGSSTSIPNSSTSSVSIPEILIGGHSIDGQTGANTLAYNFYPHTGDMVIDTDNTGFYGNPANGSRAARNVIVHEAGHGIGVGHVESSDADFLMEPYVNTGFDGPQFDDILAFQRGYGDAWEKGGGNDTAGTASDLGTLAAGATVRLGTSATSTAVADSATDFVSSDDNSDVDFYQFTVSGVSTVAVTLTPRGPTYNQGPQGGSQTAFDSASQADLTLRLLSTDGLTVLGTANAGGAGTTESLPGVSLPAAGTYFVQVQNATNAVQFYGLAIEASGADTTAPAVRALARTDPNPTAAAGVQFNATFSESVTGVEAGDFAVVPGGGVTGAAVTGVSGSGSSYTVTVNTGTGNGTLGLNLVDDDSIRDGASNRLGGTGAGNGNFTGEVYTVDKGSVTTWVLDNGDAGFSATGSWTPYSGQGYQNDLQFSEAGSGADVASWTFSGLASGDYQVAITWAPRRNRATDAPFRIWNGAAQMYAATVNQELTPAADEVESGVPFQHLGGPVHITSGTLIVQLTDLANEYVIADAVRIELVPSVPDTTPPTGDLADPSSGGTIDVSLLNGRGYLDVTFTDVGSSGLDAATIDGDELSLSGAGVGTAVLGTPTLQAGSTYRYAFSGAFAAGTVTVQFVAGSFADVAGNGNAAETESFVVGTTPAVQIIDNGDAGFSDCVFVPYGGQGYQNDMHYAAGDHSGDYATWTFAGLASGDYQVAVTWPPRANRATNSPFGIWDDASQVYSARVNQELTPAADEMESGVPFQHLGGAVRITSGTLVVRLTDDANEYVIADAVRIELVPSVPDTTPPTGDLADPSSGGTVDGSLLNGRGYLDVMFTDSGGSGLDAASINGGELSLSGAGVGTAVLVGAPTWQGGNTYRYAFSGGFVPGAVNVGFVAGSFADLASNVNAAETESFTVETAPTVRILDNGSDPAFALTGSWLPYGGQGFESDMHYSAAGSGADVARWTFAGLASGDYQVAMTWPPRANRATNAPFSIWDGAEPKYGAAVNQELTPAADEVESGVPFQHLGGPVHITSGTLIVQLTDLANEYVIADAVRIELVPSVPDTAPPTADLADPSNAGTISQVLLNARGYLDVTFADTGGSGLDTATINGNELSLSGAGVGTATLAGTAISQGGNTYRYAFSGEFVPGAVQVQFVAGSFLDLAGNANVAESESFAVQAAPAVRILDNGDDGFSTAGSWTPYSGQGYQSDMQYSAAGSGADVASWTFTGQTAGTYRVSATWPERRNRATNSPFRIDGGAAIPINQENAPSSFPGAFQADGVYWVDLNASYVFGGGTLTVTLSDAANEYVIADAIRIERLGALHAAEIGPPGAADLAGLAPADIARVRDAAVGYWSALDAEAAQRLSTTQVVIADLPATLLGLASASTQTVWLDAEAAGFGWQVEAESRERRAESQSHYDSLTVLTHEFGHVLGYDDLDPWPESSAIMTGVLPPAARRVPTDEGLGRGSSSRSHNAQRSTLNSAVDGWFLDVGRSATIFEPGRRPEPEREAVSSDWVISSRQSKKDEELLELLARARTSGEREAAPDGLFADLGADEA